MIVGVTKKRTALRAASCAGTPAGVAGGLGGGVRYSARAGNHRFSPLRKRPPRPYKTAIQTRFTVENAKGV
jgi:hypothetical protein